MSLFKRWARRARTNTHTHTHSHAHTLTSSRRGDALWSFLLVGSEEAMAPLVLVLAVTHSLTVVSSLAGGLTVVATAVVVAAAGWAAASSSHSVPGRGGDEVTSAHV